MTNGINEETLQVKHIDGLVQDCSNSSALAMELLKSCAKAIVTSIRFATDVF